MIHTSGSTGMPKGVPIRHRQVLALLDAALPLFDVGPADGWTLFHSYAFDFSVWELWGALSTGGRLVCVPDLLRVHPAGFAELLARDRVTVLNLVPSVFRQLRPDGPALRHVIFGGETLDPATLAGWPLDGRRVSNMYGITETTVHVTHRFVGAEDLARGEPGSLIGHPLPHLGVTLVDDELRPVPPGSRGEILVTGAGVAEGYLHRPELTERRFPVRPGRGRCFRSGDLATWSPEHGLVHHGRSDGQVQFRGFRVELGEIESTLRRAGGVTDAVVTLDRTAAGEDVLAAWVVCDRRDAGTVPGLRRELARFLPRHLVPERVTLLDRLPRTASGKLDRNALTAPPPAPPAP